MISVRHPYFAAMAMAVLFTFCDGVSAQNLTEAEATEGSQARSRWQQRVLQQGQASLPGTDSGHSVRSIYRDEQWSPRRTAPVRAVSAPMLTAADDGPTLGDEAIEIVPRPRAMGPGDPEIIDLGTVDERMLSGEEMMGPGPMAPGQMGMVDSEFGCGDCGHCSDGCGDCGFGCGSAAGGTNALWWARDLSLFVGTHGFKGPQDRGRNGNFGLHEGVNFGAELGRFPGVGYQLGIAAVHSNFAGDQTEGTLGGNRDQIFFTGGMFRRRLEGGWQWGVAFDLLHDVYYDNSDLRQIRTETSYRFANGLREIGYFGAYGTGGDDLILLDRTRIGLQTTDMFAIFYRRYFTAGGEGRFWGGITGDGDGLLGADVRVPIGKRWALENRINYLIPKEGRNSGGQSQEAWGLSISLVWYAGQPARCVDRSPFRPMFNVADNTTFMSDNVVRTN